MAARSHGLQGSIIRTILMQISISISGLETTGRNLSRTVKNIDGVKNTIITKSLQVIERFGKYYSPVKTGRMRASIGGGAFQGGVFSQGEGIERGESFAVIGPTVEYAKFVHRRIPFMSTALISSITPIERIAKEEVRKALK